MISYLDTDENGFEEIECCEDIIYDDFDYRQLIPSHKELPLSVLKTYDKMVAEMGFYRGLNPFLVTETVYDPESDIEFDVNGYIIDIGEGGSHHTLAYYTLWRYCHHYPEMVKLAVKMYRARKKMSAGDAILLSIVYENLRNTVFSIVGVYQQGFNTYLQVPNFNYDIKKLKYGINNTFSQNKKLSNESRSHIKDLIDNRKYIKALNYAKKC